MSEIIYSASSAPAAGADNDSASGGNIIGYACSELVANNADQLIDFDLIFYIDAASPTGQQDVFIEHIQKTLVPLIGSRYGISSDNGCMSPPIDGTSWILQFTLDRQNFEPIDIFDGCRTLQSSAETQDCRFYQVTLSGKYIGSGRNNNASSDSSATTAAMTAAELKDVVNFLELTVDSAALTKDLNDELFLTKFDGVPVYDDAVNNSDAGRDNLNDAVNDGANADSIVSSQPAQNNNSPDRTTITIVGGLLVAAFGLAFFGICFILYRRRQYFIRSRQVHMSQWENGDEGEGGLDLDGNNKQFSPYGDENGDGPTFVTKDSGIGDLERYNTSNTEEEKDDEYGNDTIEQHQYKHQQEPPSHGSSRDSPTQPDLESSLDDNLGASLKDQLMGIHGSLGGSKGNALNHPPNRGTFGSLFPSTQSVDGDSDADSWAQTDGTIGSLEIGLEPITAEI